MKLNKKAELIIGLIFGLLTPMFGVAIFIQIYPVLTTVTHWNDPSWQLILMRLVTFGVMMNVLVFFMALKFDKDKIAYGVLWACGIYLLPVLFMQITR